MSDQIVESGVGQRVVVNIATGTIEEMYIKEGPFGGLRRGYYRLSRKLTRAGTFPASKHDDGYVYADGSGSHALDPDLHPSREVEANRARIRIQQLQDQIAAEKKALRALYTLSDTEGPGEGEQRAKEPRALENEVTV